MSTTTCTSVLVVDGWALRRSEEVDAGAGSGWLVVERLVVLDGSAVSAFSAAQWFPSVVRAASTSTVLRDVVLLRAAVDASADARVRLPGVAESRSERSLLVPAEVDSELRGDELADDDELVSSAAATPI
ncbi:hypothetical protein [Mycobacterium sp. SMC-4]|uniref:hypothetical protein n=1 Tax=Mycobacterium sp. SMC-4 TaxID=2857059 RepID=UPI0021B35CCA|nr:hypothetical protein [Mycobacterium sp. SMC-4]UXA17139.1 hypothetical protein KXD98_20690 [Mycobacterium sp. SMC-4]